jgi:integrase
MARKNDGDRIVRSTPAPAKGNIRVPVEGARGLNVLVTAGGWRGFVLRYRIHGRERSYTIGAWPDWSTERARARAGELRVLIDQGTDPHERDAQARDEAVTVAEFWARVYEPLHVPTLRPTWAKDVRAIMRNDVLPRLGRRLVKEIDRADAAALHRAVTKRGSPGRANRVLAVFSNLMSQAELPHVLENGTRIPALRPRGSNPCYGLKRNPENARRRYLEPDEMARLAEVLDHHPERVTVALIRFLLLTGARFGEAASATWAEINLVDGIWTKPSAHTKQKREHVVPLSPQAVALLQQLRAHTGSGRYVFPGSSGRPITRISTAWRTICQRAQLRDLRVHDLRHSYASVLAGKGSSLLVIGQLLGHTQAKTTMRYAHLFGDVLRAATAEAGAAIMPVRAVS